MLDKIAPYYKALAALLVPFLTQLGAATAPNSDGMTEITLNEWLTAIIAGLLAGGVVFAVPNKDPQATHQDESVQPPDDGVSPEDGFEDVPADPENDTHQY